MKRYKLLKDLPTFEAGDLFYISQSGDLVQDGGMYNDTLAYTEQTLRLFPNILAEWFEKISESTSGIHWRPQKGEKYWISHLGGNVSYLVWTGYPDDYNYYNLGRIYHTKEACEKARDRELAEARLRRTSNFKPDFNNKNTGNGYVVGYDYLNKKLFIERVLFRDYGEVVYYETKEEAKISIEENERDWKIYFGIEENK